MEVEKTIDISEESKDSEESIELSPSEYLDSILRKAQSASRPLGALTAAVKNQALDAMATGLEESGDSILEANEKDLIAFEGNASRAAMADRLRLTPERISGMAKQIRAIVALRDPVGESLG
ncbi:MAG: hypothetical protein R3351_04290, partial [Nitrospirales bacterium]|nr:hypothetical protein [Nitrospirales bacterium]